MKDGIVDTIGKTIVSVIVKERQRAPRRQVFFVFSDDTYFELYGDDIQGISALRSGGRDAVIEYMSSGRVIIDAHSD